MIDENSSLDPQNRRKKAEELLAEKKSQKKRFKLPITAKKLIHELEVHQIELELQNEELIQARFEAQEAGSKYEELYDFAPSSYITFGRGGVIEGLNLNAARMLEKDRSNLINKRFGQFVNQETRALFEQFLKNAFISNAHETCDLVLKVNDTPAKIVHLQGIVKVNSEHCFVIMLDTTEDGKAANELRESERRYHSLFENSPIPLWELDYSRIFRKLAELKNLGITDIERYLTENPQKLIKFVLLIKVLDVNNEAIKIFKADSREMLMKSYMKIFTELTGPVFIQSLQC
ncbi:MAG: PAS domain-containing protein, partial [Candidatus Stygibacter frigidus]|nr:PAS domain-containing protein [Candidatus Stygibacter frigidus]